MHSYLLFLIFLLPGVAWNKQLAIVKQILPTLEACAKACMEETSIDCKYFKYAESSKTCFLASKPTENTGKGQEGISPTLRQDFIALQQYLIPLDHKLQEVEVLDSHLNVLEKLLNNSARPKDKQISRAWSVLNVHKEEIKNLMKKLINKTRNLKQKVNELEDFQSKTITNLETLNKTTQRIVNNQQDVRTRSGAGEEKVVKLKVTMSGYVKQLTDIKKKTSGIKNRLSKIKTLKDIKPYRNLSDHLVALSNNYVALLDEVFELKLALEKIVTKFPHKGDAMVPINDVLRELQNHFLHLKDDVTAIPKPVGIDRVGQSLTEVKQTDGNLERDMHQTRETITKLMGEISNLVQLNKGINSEINTLEQSDTDLDQKMTLYTQQQINKTRAGIAVNASVTIQGFLPILDKKGQDLTALHRTLEQLDSSFRHHETAFPKLGERYKHVIHKLKKLDRRMDGVGRVLKLLPHSKDSTDFKKRLSAIKQHGDKLENSIMGFAKAIPAAIKMMETMESNETLSHKQLSDGLESYTRRLDNLSETEEDTPPNVMKLGVNNKESSESYEEQETVPEKEEVKLRVKRISRPGKKDRILRNRLTDRKVKRSLADELAEEEAEISELMEDDDLLLTAKQINNSKLPQGHNANDGDHSLTKETLKDNASNIKSKESPDSTTQILKHSPKQKKPKKMETSTTDNDKKEKTTKPTNVVDTKLELGQSAASEKQAMDKANAHVKLSKQDNNNTKHISTKEANLSKSAKHQQKPEAPMNKKKSAWVTVDDADVDILDIIMKNKAGARTEEKEDTNRILLASNEPQHHQDDASTLHKLLNAKNHTVLTKPGQQPDKHFLHKSRNYRKKHRPSFLDGTYGISIQLNKVVVNTVPEKDTQVSKTSYGKGTPSFVIGKDEIPTIQLEIKKEEDKQNEKEKRDIKAPICPSEKYTNVNGYCYMIIPRLASYMMTRLLCSKENAEIATPGTDEKYESFLRFLKSSESIISMDKVWISPVNPFPRGLIWDITGEPVDTTKLKQPTTQYQCVTMDILSGLAQNETCGDFKYSESTEETTRNPHHHWPACQPLTPNDDKMKNLMNFMMSEQKQAVANSGRGQGAGSDVTGRPEVNSVDVDNHKEEPAVSHYDAVKKENNSVYEKKGEDSNYDAGNNNNSPVYEKKAGDNHYDAGNKKSSLVYEKKAGDSHYDAGYKKSSPVYEKKAGDSHYDAGYKKSSPVYEKKAGDSHYDAGYEKSSHVYEKKAGDSHYDAGNKKSSPVYEKKAGNSPYDSGNKNNSPVYEKKAGDSHYDAGNKKSSPVYEKKAGDSQYDAGNKKSSPVYEKKAGDSHYDAGNKASSHVYEENEPNIGEFVDAEDRIGEHQAIVTNKYDDINDNYKSDGDFQMIKDLSENIISMQKEILSDARQHRKAEKRDTKDSGSEYVCPSEKYTNVNGYCYMIIPRLASYMMTKLLCSKENAEMATPGTDEKYESFLKFLKSSESIISMDRVWISPVNPFPRDLIWDITGERVDTTKLKQPTTQFQCVTMDMSSGLVQNETCGDFKYSESTEETDRNPHHHWPACQPFTPVDDKMKNLINFMMSEQKPAGVNSGLGQGAGSVVTGRPEVNSVDVDNEKEKAVASHYDTGNKKSSSSVYGEEAGHSHNAVDKESNPVYEKNAEERHYEVDKKSNPVYEKYADERHYAIAKESSPVYEEKADERHYEVNKESGPVYGQDEPNIAKSVTAEDGIGDHQDIVTDKYNDINHNYKSVGDVQMVKDIPENINSMQEEILNDAIQNRKAGKRDTKGSESVCPSEKYTNVNGYCYMIIPRLTSYMMAKNLCAKENAEMAAPGTEEKYESLIELLKSSESVISTDKVWLSPVNPFPTELMWDITCERVDTTKLKQPTTVAQCVTIDMASCLVQNETCGDYKYSESTEETVRNPHHHWPVCQPITPDDVKRNNLISFMTTPRSKRGIAGGLSDESEVNYFKNDKQESFNNQHDEFDNDYGNDDEEEEGEEEEEEYDDYIADDIDVDDDNGDATKEKRGIAGNNPYGDAGSDQAYAGFNEDGSWSTASSCPTEFFTNVNGFCFTILPMKTSHIMAKSMCQRYDGELVSPATTEELESFIWFLKNAQLLNDTVWISAINPFLGSILWDITAELVDTATLSQPYNGFQCTVLNVTSGLVQNETCAENKYEDSSNAFPGNPHHHNPVCQPLTPNDKIYGNLMKRIEENDQRTNHFKSKLSNANFAPPNAPRSRSNTNSARPTNRGGNGENAPINRNPSGPPVGNDRFRQRENNQRGQFRGESSETTSENEEFQDEDESVNRNPSGQPVGNDRFGQRENNQRGQFRGESSETTSENEEFPDEDENYKEDEFEEFEEFEDEPEDDYDTQNTDNMRPTETRDSRKRSPLIPESSQDWEEDLEKDDDGYDDGNDDDYDDGNEYMFDYKDAPEKTVASQQTDTIKRMYNKDQGKRSTDTGRKVLAQLQSASTCPNEFYTNMDGYCYTVVQKLTSYKAAKSMCEIYQGELVSPSSTEELETFIKFLKENTNPSVSNGTVWLSAANPFRGYYIWDISAEQIDSTKFRQQHTGYQCMVLNITSGLFQNETCEGNMYEESTNEVPPNPQHHIPVCQPETPGDKVINNLMEPMKSSSNEDHYAGKTASATKFEARDPNESDSVYLDEGDKYDLSESADFDRLGNYVDGRTTGGNMYDKQMGYLQEDAFNKDDQGDVESEDEQLENMPEGAVNEDMMSPVMFDANHQITYGDQTSYSDDNEQEDIYGPDALQGERTFRSPQRKKKSMDSVENTPRSLKSGLLSSCPSSVYTKVQGYCFAALAKQTSYLMAKSMCKQREGELVTPSSSDELNIFVQYLKTAHPSVSNKTVWISAAYPLSGTYIWDVSAEEIDTSKFVHPYSDYQCLVLNITSGVYQNETCGEGMYEDSTNETPSNPQHHTPVCQPATPNDQLLANLVQRVNEEDNETIPLPPYESHQPVDSMPTQSADYNVNENSGTSLDGTTEYNNNTPQLKTEADDKEPMEDIHDHNDDNEDNPENSLEDDSSTTVGEKNYQKVAADSGTPNLYRRKRDIKHDMPFSHLRRKRNLVPSTPNGFSRGEQCPSHFTQSPRMLGHSGTFCFLVSEIAVSFDKVDEYCNKLSGVPVSPNTEEKNNALVAAILRAGIHKGDVWLSQTERMKGVWKWKTSSQPVVFSNFVSYVGEGIRCSRLSIVDKKWHSMVCPKTEYKNIQDTPSNFHRVVCEPKEQARRGGTL